MLSFVPQNDLIGFQGMKVVIEPAPPPLANQKGDIAQFPTLKAPPLHPPKPQPRPGHAQVAETTGLEGGVVEGGGGGQGRKGKYTRWGGPKMR